MIEHAVGEQAFDDSEAGGAERFGLGETPLGIAHEIRLSIRRHVLVYRGASAGFEQTRMHGDQFVLAVDARAALGATSNQSV